MTRPSGARWSSHGSVSATQARLVTSSTSCQRFELLSSGLNSRKFREFRVQLHDIAQEPAHHAGGLGRDGAGCGHLDGVITEIREPQLAQQQAAIGVRVGTHAPGALRGEFGQFGPEAAVAVEQFRGLVALHPLFEDAHMSGVLVHLSHRHLMRAPVALGAPAVDLFRAGPSLWGAKHDHRPERALR